MLVCVSVNGGGHYLLEHRPPISAYVTIESDMPSPGYITCLRLMSPSLRHNEMPVGSVLSWSYRGKYGHRELTSTMTLSSPEDSVWQHSSNEQGHISFASRVTAEF